MKFTVAAAAALATAAQVVHAQQACGTGDFPQDGVNIIEGGNCGADPNDGSDFEILLQACPFENEVLTAALTFTGTDGAVSATTVSQALTSVAVATNLAFQFPGLAVTDFSVGGVITTSLAFDNGDAFDPFTETFSPVTSLVFADSTTTVTTLVTEGTATSTVTGVVTVTNTNVQSTTTSACSTGVVTSRGSTVTRSTTSTVTPKPRTKTVLVGHTTTVRPTCIPAAGRRRAVRDLEERQAANVGNFEPLFCPALQGNPGTTTITTNTNIVTQTAGTSVTSTVLATSTVTVTTGSTAAITVCVDPTRTTTVHPTTTGTFITILGVKTTTITKTHVATRTIYPAGATVCGYRKNAAKLATHAAHVAKPSKA